MLKTIARNQRLDACTTPEERKRVIRDSADQEVLYDQPEEDRGRIRVSGPFTVEAIPVPSLEAGEAMTAEPVDPDRPTTTGRVDDPAGDYLTMMIDLVRKTGITFPNGRQLRVPSIHAVKGPYEYLHAEAASDMEGDPRRIALSFGTKHGPVTQGQVIGACREAWNYQWVIFIGFACDPDARQRIDAGAQGQQLDFANAAPDILVGDLLKTKKTSALFTVFGAPDVTVHKEADGAVSVEVIGVDLYDPITGSTTHGRGEDVAAWFVDHEYDGRTFCICQALFPGRSTKNPWEKLQKALKGTIDEDRFEQLRQTRSLPFKPGKKIAVTVIDDRGNEVIKVVEPKSAR
jgi:adenine-specific DNA-methyltransferase